MDEEKCLTEFIGNAAPKHRERLRAGFTRLNLDRGQFVFFEGDPAESLYLIESGVVEANIVHGDGKVYIFHFLLPGDIFGEGVIYGQEFYPFSAVVRKDAFLWKIGKEELMKAAGDDTSLRNHLLKQVGRKLDHSYAKARCIAGERVEKRVACILLKSIGEDGLHADCGEKLDLPLTNRDISGLIGSTEETVSRVMSRLKKDGVIGIRNKQLVVLDRESLLKYLRSE